LTELDILVSERQDFSFVMDVMALVGKQLIRLRCQRSLYYGSDATLQHLTELAETTPELRVLDLLEHFCGGWGNPPCIEVNGLQIAISLCYLTPLLLIQYLSDLETLALDGKWTKLRTVNWTSHLSCHDHLVYWSSAGLCGRIFEALPSVDDLTYTEECRLEVNSAVTFSYQRMEPAGVEWRDVFRGVSKPLEVV
jgi:hypothetical protein